MKDPRRGFGMQLGRAGLSLGVEFGVDSHRNPCIFALVGVDSSFGPSQVLQLITTCLLLFVHYFVRESLRTSKKLGKTQVFFLVK